MRNIILPALLSLCLVGCKAPEVAPDILVSQGSFDGSGKYPALGYLVPRSGLRKESLNPPTSDSVCRFVHIKPESWSSVMEMFSYSKQYGYCVLASAGHCMDDCYDYSKASKVEHKLEVTASDNHYENVTYAYAEGPWSKMNRSYGPLKEDNYAH